MTPVYITGLGVFLPNAPVSNDEIEDVLGHINKRSSQVKQWVLNYNGIQSRHYAIDPENGEVIYTNAQMTAYAIRKALDDARMSPSKLTSRQVPLSLAKVIRHGPSWRFAAHTRPSPSGRSAAAIANWSGMGVPGV